MTLFSGRVAVQFRPVLLLTMKRSGSHLGAVGRSSTKRSALTVLQPGWQGIFVTCPRKKESACRDEARNIFSELAEELYGESESNCQEAGTDIEEQIRAEVAALGKKSEAKVSTHLIGCECVVFVRIKDPIDPVRLVLETCAKLKNSRKKLSRYIQRMTPVWRFVPANVDNVSQFTPEIERGFDKDNLAFAVRSTIRNNTDVNRDELIASIARLIGKAHHVDLKNYDRLVLVECFRSVIGLSVVDRRFEEYARFNYSQMYEKLLSEQAADTVTVNKEAAEETN